MNHSSPNEPSLDNNDGEINLDQLLSAQIQITSQPLMEWSTTTRMPSQIPRNPNSALHPIRRQQQQRGRQRQQQREQNETPTQRQQRQQRQQDRIQSQQEQQQERERQRQQRQSMPIIATRHRHRSYSDVEWEHQYYFSLDFSEDLDDVDPHEHLQLLELESMDPIERAAHEQLEQYEQSLRPQPLTSIASSQY
ncbi:unnamed protein product [Rotaria magnacalcarata]|uniref:Uncharacterized protein n=1 Tax=Rotaria magnacalcarata TaxID=392030 RepID=A0A814KE32_9BILA|nr:unnamed protein product [Rotaria magnacalcarata]CAF1648988.1 unnamed protein product [Rotaria magnacalcarata]CAF2147420.1 unnamed protein product [Rotaria magnacalcarata]CAF2150162.1 unnamed protein product [Rotaria magnacalcarata]CAF3968415.1 unnamed protein product [Rotaria magnacalcarata]